MMHFKAISFSSALLILFAVTFSGCSTIGYYSQVIAGQMVVLNNRQPIRYLLNDVQTPENVKKQLELIVELREFAETVLHLPVDNHYLSYVDLKRPYALWNVFAASEFSLTPKTWCYPVVGCTTYRGYFSMEDADDYAKELNAQGFDVYVGGVAAYSTLGWFDDPILSTFIHRDPIRLAALIFHELAHQLLYVSDDTTFNESFATAVEQEGLRRWLIAKDNIDAYNNYLSDYKRHQQFIGLIMKFQNRLTSLYEKGISPPEKRLQKAEIFDELKAEYIILKQHWNGYSEYDTWFNHELNNAQLITVSTYYELIPAFFAWLKDGGNNLDQFYRQCQKLADKPQEERRAFLLSFL